MKYLKRRIICWITYHNWLRIGHGLKVCLDCHKVKETKIGL